MNIFNSPARTFYQSVSMMHLDAIPLVAYKPFVKELFTENEKYITDELVEEVYEFFEGHTWYVQLAMNELYILTAKEETCDKPMLKTALDNIIAMQDFTYQEIFSRLPDKQKEVIVAIAKEKKAGGSYFCPIYKTISSKLFQFGAIRFERIDGEKDMVTQEQGVYQVYDKLLGVWLRRNY